MDLLDPERLKISSLGPGLVPSSLGRQECFVDDQDAVLAHVDPRRNAEYLDSGRQPPSFESAGPRARLLFEPSELTCGIVTCGGLCPGLNDVIRSIVLTLHHRYGVHRILGYRYGFRGLTPSSDAHPRLLGPLDVAEIHLDGGTVLGSSRGPQNVNDMVDTLAQNKVGILFALGGDGTMRGASAIAEEAARRHLRLSVIGIPKTIDNDLDWISRSFGFSTAVQEATASIRAAHVEAKASWNGIGLVKLMGRHSGFIAAHACLSNSDANFCLIPEVPFALHGERGLLRCLEQRLEKKAHAVIVVAEGAGQDMIDDPGEVVRDASGNVKLKNIGSFLRGRISRHFADKGLPVTIRYIDPSYLIRSLPANAIDSEFCLMLAQHAVHAGMAGRTDMVISHWNQRFVHMPISLAVGRRRQLDPSGDSWQAVLDSTGQPASMIGD